MMFRFTTHHLSFVTSHLSSVLETGDKRLATNATKGAL